MNIKLTPEQIDKLREDKYLNIDIGNGVGLYFEFGSDLVFVYGEIFDSNPKTVLDKRNTYCF